MNETFYLQEENTLISKLIQDGLGDGDIIQMSGKNLIVDIITCGSADEDFTDEVDIGVTIKNDGGEDCHLEFKDLSGIRLNASLPTTVHPWVDPLKPLPAFLDENDPEQAVKIIHNDPYCTKLTANARAEIQLAGGFGINSDANLPTETRENGFYACTKSFSYNSSTGEYTVEFDRDINLHTNDIGTFLTVHSNMSPCKIINYNSISKIAIVKPILPRSLSTTTKQIFGLTSGGIVLSLYGGYSQGYIFSSVIGGTINLITKNNNVNCNFSIASKCINVDRLGLSAYITLSYTQTSFGYCNAYINQFIGATLINTAGQEFLYNPKTLHINKACFFGTIFNTAIRGIFLNSIYIGGGIWCSNGAGSTGYYMPYSSGIGLIIKEVEIPFITPNVSGSAIHFINCILGNKNTGNKYLSNNGEVILSQLQNNSWHHKPNSATATTWKYTDHCVPPNKSLHLKVRRMIESASSSSEARVAVTDTANWYPQTKYGAFSELVMNNLEIDKWQTYSLKWRNDSDEPQQVRVWECASGSTDGGYLKVEEARGGAL